MLPEPVGDSMRPERMQSGIGESLQPISGGGVFVQDGLYIFFEMLKHGGVSHGQGRIIRLSVSTRVGQQKFHVGLIRLFEYHTSVAYNCHSGKGDFVKSGDLFLSILHIACQLRQEIMPAAA